MSTSADCAPAHPFLWNEKALWSRRRDPEVKAVLADRFLGFAQKIALRYASVAESTEDLVQVANVGLMNAIERFDPSKGIPFRAFAGPTINGELRRHYRDRVSTIRLPRGVYERVGRMESVNDDLRGSLSRDPTLAETAEAMHCSEEQVTEARGATIARRPMGFRQQADEGGISEEMIGSVDGEYSKSENRIVGGNAFHDLKSSDQEILRLRYAEEMSQAEIAERIGCSQMQVSRHLRRIIDELYEAISRDDPEHRPA